MSLLPPGLWWLLCPYAWPIMPYKNSIEVPPGKINKMSSLIYFQQSFKLITTSAEINNFNHNI